jgi:hypothetical protein
VTVHFVESVILSGGEAGVSDRTSAEAVDIVDGNAHAGSAYDDLRRCIATAE